MHPYQHSEHHAKLWGGKPEDYLPINDFIDSTKSGFANWKHRLILHNAFGCFIAERVFGSTITNSDGRVVPVRVIAESHIKQDIGFVPSIQDWLQDFEPPKDNSWMRGNGRLIRAAIKEEQEAVAQQQGVADD